MKKKYEKPEITVEKFELENHAGKLCGSWDSEIPDYRNGDTE